MPSAQEIHRMMMQEQRQIEKQIAREIGAKKSDKGKSIAVTGDKGRRGRGGQGRHGY
jgi:hypothetical protein